MLLKILDYFKDEQDADPSFIRLTRNIVFFVIVVNIALLPLVTGLIGGEGSRNPPAFITLLITLILELISIYYVLRGRVRMAKLVVPLSLIIAVVVISLNSNGLKNSSMVGLPIILVISAILLGRRALLITPLAIGATIFIAFMDLSGRIKIVRTGLDDAIIAPILLLACSGIIQLLIARLNESIQRARLSETIQKQENLELNELRSSLEERVNQRTADLNTANQSNERRAKQFEAIAQVARAISSIQDLEVALPRITQVISEQFGHYHTGIFLLDDNREFAVLRAANSQGGRRMLKNEHKLPVGQTGIVGYVTATGRPRIALDVGLDAVYFDNPFLPTTHSEIALPLRVAGQVIGALDVQSEMSKAFTEDDIEVLSTLADQVAIAIKNTRTLEDARISLAEAQSAYSQSTLESWKIMRPETTGLGYQLTGSTTKVLEKPIEGKHIQEAMETGRTVVASKNKTSNLAIPIRLRDKVVGIISLKTAGEFSITEDEVDIAEAIAERLSLAIETATLLRSTQHRADVEKVTAEITTKISSSTRFDAILQTAAQELSRALGGDVVVQVEPLAMKMDTQF